MRKLLPGLLLALVVAALLGAAGVAVDRFGYSRAETKYQGEIAALKRAHAEAMLKAEREARATFESQNRNLLRQTEALIDAKATIDAQTRELQKERAKNVSTLYREVPDEPLRPVPGWIVTNGWLCDYNRAIGYGVSDPASGDAGVEEEACKADAFAPSGVTAEEILRHHAEYGGYCRKLEQQIDRLVDHIECIERGPDNKDGKVCVR